MKRLLLMFVLLPCAIQQNFAQTVIFFKPFNPSQFYLDDVWNINISQFDKTANVFLSAEIKESNGKQVVLLSSEATELPIGLNELNQFKIKTKELFVNPSYALAEQLRSSRSLSFGIYEICITVKDAHTNEELASECAPYEYQPVTPPTLVYPLYCEPLTIKNPNFTWLPPSPLPNGYQVVYDLKICELFAGQTYEDAINRNNPVYAAKDLQTTSHLYPSIAEAFDSSRTYIWQVSARIPRPGGQELPEEKEKFSSIGISEVWCFNKPVKEEKPEPEPTTYIYPQSMKTSGHVNVLNTLYLAYEEKYLPGNLNISFYDNKGVKIDYDQILNLKRGDNRFALNLKATSKFRHKEFYTIKIVNAKNESFVMKFQYAEKY